MMYRRDAMIRLGRLGLGSLGLSTLFEAERARAAGGTAVGKARSCILIYLWGGPPQQDMFDMKPDAPAGIRSPFAPIATRVPGLDVSDQLPNVARVADKFAVIRSMNHGSNLHESSVYHTMTGKVKTGLVVPSNFRRRSDSPNVGSIISRFSPTGPMPASVTIPRPIGHDGVIYAGTYGGFLGPRHDPMEIKPPAEVAEVAPHSLSLAEGLDPARLLARDNLLHRIEAEDRRLQSGHSRSDDPFREQAFRMLASPSARRAFDVESEDPRVRDRYGRNEYGESFLLARRLVEAGVRLVTVVWYYVAADGNVLNVWDNHGGTASLNKITGYQMLREYYCLPSFDLAYSALLDDLDARGLLDETLVVATGEFGRTPKINKDQGRDHWGMCYSALLAGGGVRGGQVYGGSDKHAAYPRDRPVAPEDLLATIYHAMGIDPGREIADREGRPYRISDGKPVVDLFG